MKDTTVQIVTLVIGAIVIAGSVGYWAGINRMPLIASAETTGSSLTSLPEGWTVEFNDAHQNYRFCYPHGFCPSERLSTYQEAVNRAAGQEKYERGLLAEKWRKVSNSAVTINNITPGTDSNLFYHR